MAAPGTLTAAYKSLKAVVPPNIRTCWSSVLLDGSAIMGQFWVDQFVVINAYGSQRYYIGDTVDNFGKDSIGFKKWREHLDWAWRHNRRILIIEVRREPGASPDKFLPKKDTVMSSYCV